MPLRLTYVERLNQAMEAKGLSPDELARRCGYPLDLVGPLLAGRPEAFSERMNQELCDVLGLDAAEMWALALSQQHAAARSAAAPD